MLSHRSKSFKSRSVESKKFISWESNNSKWRRKVQVLKGRENNKKLRRKNITWTTNGTKSSKKLRLVKA